MQGSREVSKIKKHNKRFDDDFDLNEDLKEKAERRHKQKALRNFRKSSEEELDNEDDNF